MLVKKKDEYVSDVVGRVSNYSPQKERINNLSRRHKVFGLEADGFVWRTEHLVDKFFHFRLIC